jgi:hypothetical protein
VSKLISVRLAFRHKLSLALAIGIAAWNCAAQTAVGSLSGTIKDDAGQTLASVAVSAVGNGPGGKTYFVTTSASGAFALSGVAPGVYSICVQEPGGPHLDPCHWGSPVQVTVGSQSPAALPSLQVVKGTVLQVRLNDPSHLLKAGPAGPPDVLVGVMLPSSLFHPMRLIANDANGYTYQVAVPAGTPAKISITSAHWSIADSAGASIGAAVSSQIPATVASGQALTAVTFTVTGRK